MKDRVYETGRNWKYDECQRELASVVYRFFNNETGPRVSVNEQLAEELHKLIIEKIQKRNVYAIFKDNIWAADLPEMRSCFLRIKMLNIY